MTTAPYHVIYHPDVRDEDLPEITSAIQKRIKKAIEIKLARAPEAYGEHLRKTLKHYWKLRVGDYRVIYKVRGKTIIVLRIGHRNSVYKSIPPLPRDLS